MFQIPKGLHLKFLPFHSCLISWFYSQISFFSWTDWNPQFRAHRFLLFFIQLHWPLSFHFPLWKQFFFPLSRIPFWFRERKVAMKGVQSHWSKQSAFCLPGNIGHLAECESKLMFKRLNEGEWEDVLRSFWKVEKNDYIDNLPLWAYKCLLNPLTDLPKWKVFSVSFHCTDKMRIKFPFVANEGYISTLTGDYFLIPPLSTEFITQEDKDKWFKNGEGAYSRG